MTKYINEVSENIFEFDLNKFMNAQGLIYDKFAQTDVEGIDLIDKYILQTLEEIHEAIERVRRNNIYDKRNISEEIIDVAMYLGSTYYTVNTGMRPTFDTIYITDNSDFRDSEAVLNDISTTLMNARRMYPERKWHKRHDKHYTNPNRDKIFAQLLVASIISLITLLVNSYDPYYASIEMERKQNYIADLDTGKKINLE
jgi:hypothetical protein